MRIALMVDSDIWNPGRMIATRSGPAFELAQAIRQYHPDTCVYPIDEDYENGVAALSKEQHSFDCLVVICFFNRLYALPSLFDSIQKPVVLIEHDACQNFMSNSPFYGKWSEYLNKSNINIIGVSGMLVNQKLRDEGFASFYLPKAAPEHFLLENNSYSGRYCAFGSSFNDPLYVEREKVFRELGPGRFMRIAGPRLHALYRISHILNRRASFDLLRFTYDKMPKIVSRYSGCIICDRGLYEPMTKHFEVSALGVVPIRDDETTDELEYLGYKDGTSMIVYDSLDELRDIVQYYFQNPAALVAMQDNARNAASQNTWKHRAIRLIEVLAQYL